MEVDMKKLSLVVIVASFAAGLPVFAQTSMEGRDSEYYYVNISLEKIYPYRAGYIVQYRKGLYQYGRTYLPSEWFTNAAGKGEILTLPSGQAWPSMTVFYKNGEFSHVRLYVHRWQSHRTWGNVPQNVNLDHNFDNIETLKISF
jgi:hypothetical protein